MKVSRIDILLHGLNAALRDDASVFVPIFRHTLVRGVASLQSLPHRRFFSEWFFEIVGLQLQSNQLFIHGFMAVVKAYEQIN